MNNYTKIFCGFLFLLLPALLKSQVGGPAPDFTVTDTHGDTHRLYDYLDAGKVVVLDFFYTTCGPCIFYSPQVNLAYQKYGCNTANVIFLSIDYDDTNDEVLDYDAEYDIEYPSASGLQGGGNEVVSLYSIIGFPTFYVIDSTRTIIDQIDPPTLQVFDFRFNQHGIEPQECNATSIVDAARTQHVELYPNPVQIGTRLTTQLPQSIYGPIRFEMVDPAGRVIKMGSVHLGDNQVVEFNIDDLASGIYFLKLDYGNINGLYPSVFVVN